MIEMPDDATPLVELSDQLLLARVRAGEEEAAAELYRRYADRLRALAVRQTAMDLQSRIDPEDIVQSVFRTFFRRAARGEYSVPPGEELWKLFLVIGLNKVRAVGAFHHAARRDTRHTAAGPAYDDILRHRADPDDQAVLMLRLAVAETLERLPPSQREVITLRLEGHEVDEISKRSGRAKRTVERVLQQFRDRMRRELFGIK